MRVTERDVLAPFCVMFSLNVILLICWTAIDPLRYERVSVEGEEWKTYGACRSDNGGYIFLYLIGTVNFCALLLACYQVRAPGYGILQLFLAFHRSAIHLTIYFLTLTQAYQARDISGDFSGKRSDGISKWQTICIVSSNIVTFQILCREQIGWACCLHLAAGTACRIAELVPGGC